LNRLSVPKIAAEPLGATTIFEPLIQSKHLYSLSAAYSLIQVNVRKVARDGRVSEWRGAYAGTRVMRVTKWVNPPGDTKFLIIVGSFFVFTKCVILLATQGYDS